MNSFQGKARRVAGAVWLLILLCATGLAQIQEKPEQLPPPIRQAMEKYPGLLPEFGTILERLQREIRLPAERSQSSLLALLPSSTTYYLALPNYGEAAQQTLEIFRDELKKSDVLRKWWQDEVGKSGPEIEDAFEKFSAISQYLGDEVVVSGSTRVQNHVPLVVAEIRKPGLKAYLLQALQELPEKSRSEVRVLEPGDLASPKATAGTKPATVPPELFVLVRPDVLIASPDMRTIREFNRVLDAKVKEFAATPFGQRVAQAYSGGVSSIAAGDLETILKEIPMVPAANRKSLDRSGFGDVKYLVWERKTAEGKSLSESELSFTGPRRGVASWLAAPSKLGSLEFVSPRAPFVVALSFKNLAEIFDDVRELARASNPNAFADLPAMEAAAHLSLKDDLLGQLAGEVTVAINGVVDQQVDWNAILRVQDADRLQGALAQIGTMASARSHDTTEDGVTYHSVVIPSKQKDMRLEYAFTGGYLVVGPTHESVTQRIGTRKSGQGLAAASGFHASLPPGHSSEASALLYEDAGAIMAMQMRRIAPEAAAKLAQVSAEPIPVSFFAYGEPNAIRTAGASGGADVGAILVIAAIAIPNLLRARMAANESSAAGTLRTVATAQVAYSTLYPKRGYAATLAALGPNPRNPEASSPEHAGFIDPELGKASCTSGAWCVKTGYRFSMKAICAEQRCREFVAVGTPLSNNTGTKNFCVTSDSLIRVRTAAPLTTPISVAECKGWPTLK